MYKSSSTCSIKASETHLHMLEPINLKIQQAQRDVYTLEIPWVSFILSIGKVSWLKLYDEEDKHPAADPRLLTRLSHKPPGCLHSSNPALPLLKPDVWCASELWRWRVSLKCDGQIDDCVPVVLVEFFLEAAARTTQKKWLLSTSWLMIKRDVVYFSMAP